MYAYFFDSICCAVGFLPSNLDFEEASPHCPTSFEANDDFLQAAQLFSAHPETQVRGLDVCKGALDVAEKPVR